MQCCSGKYDPAKGIRLVVMLVVAATMFSCNSESSKQGAVAADTTAPANVAVAPAPAYDASLAKRQVMASVACISDKAATYALYLPSYYSPEKAFPCIYFFDAHARGVMPVSMYHKLAERYGFILIGSNVSKNGDQAQVMEATVNTLFADTRTRINIDPKRVYTSGFSGGSRVASTIAIMGGGVAGVIGCAAGFPPVDQAPKSKFDYCGIVGSYDFNLMEMTKLDAGLQQSGLQHQLLVFTGTHGWAPVADFQMAMLWMQVNGMKEQLQVRNDTLIAELKSNFDKRIASATSSGDLLVAYRLIDGVARVLDGLADVAGYRKQLAAMGAGAPYKAAIEQQQKLQKEEVAQQQELAKQFGSGNESWWVEKTAQLNKDSKSGKSPQAAQMNHRLLSYMGLLSYMYTNGALKEGNLAKAALYMKAFKLADPKNADCSYLAAVYFVKSGDNKKAIAALNEAGALGYSDVLQLTTDPTFSSLYDTPDFKQVVQKVTSNQSL